MTLSNVLPFYVLCDISASMRQDCRIDALNDVLASTCDIVAAYPVIADRVRLSVLAFSDEARVVLPLCDPAWLEEVPVLTSEGLTSYAAGFSLLRDTIEQDVRQLVIDELRVHRPVAFFLSDGQPTDRQAMWRAALARVHDRTFPHRPNIVTFGFGEATSAVLAEVATVVAYRATDAVTPAVAIASFGAMLVESIVASGTTGSFALPDVAGVELEELALGADLL